MNKSSLLWFAAAAAIGVAYHWMAVSFWGLYAARNPINDWLLDAFARQGSEMAYRVSISIHDVIVNLVLAVPVAVVFLFASRLNNWRYPIVAAASAITVGFLNTKWDAFPLLLGSWGFWLGLGMSAFSLPLAFGGVRFIGSSQRA